MLGGESCTEQCRNYIFYTVLKQANIQGTSKFAITPLLGVGLGRVLNRSLKVLTNCSSNRT